MKTTKLILSVTIGALLCATSLYAENDRFVKKNSAANKSFIKSMAKNRAYMGVEGSRSVKVRGDKEFKEAMESGQLDQQSSGSRLTKQYTNIEISNVRINQDDLKNRGGDVAIGSRVQSEREKIMQNIEIKNSKIETDGDINVGIISSSDKVSGITNVNTIDRSELIGGSGDSSMMDREDMSLSDR